MLIAGWPISRESDRLTALATVLSVEGSKCTLPATSATAMPDESTGIWDIDCNEGNFTLILSENGGGTVVINNGKSGNAGTDVPANSAPNSDASGSNQPIDNKPSVDMPPPSEMVPLSDDNTPSSDKSSAGDRSSTGDTPHSSHSGDE
jgi:hypothetical protein